MRIAFLNWRDMGHQDSGGAELIVHQVGRRWAKAGHDVTLYSSRAPGLAAVEADDGLRIERIGFLKRGTHHAFAPRAALAGSPDLIIESVNTFPYLLPVRRGVPSFVPFVHQLAVDVWQEHLPRRLSLVAERLEPLLWQPYRSTPMLAYSNSTKEDLHRMGIRTVDVIPQGGTGPQPLRPKDDPPTFLWVGRLVQNKRPHHAIEAFQFIRRDYPNARLWIAGEGPMKRQLDRAIPGVELLGRLPHDEVLDRMGRAHMLLVTSTREGWGLVVTEANAVGTVAVAYDVPGLRDSVQGDITGILTPPNPRELARVATSLLREPSRYEQLRQNAIQWGARHTWDRMAEAFLRQVEARVAPRAANTRTSSEA